MPELIPGFNTEQKTVTVVNTDTNINDEITAQAADEWTAALLILSGSNMVILFTRTIPIAAE